MAATSGSEKTPPKGEKAISSTFTTAPLFNEVRLDTQYGSQVKRYSVIARNPIVKSALDLVASGVFWPESSVKANPKNNYDDNPEFRELDDEIIELLDRQLNTLGLEKDTAPNATINPDWLGVLKSILMDGRTYGFSISELVWETTEKGKHRLEKIKPKPPWNFDFIVNDKDELEKIKHSDTTQQLLEPDRFIIGVWPELKWGNYYGVSDLQSIEHDVAMVELLEESLIKGGSYAAFRPLIAHLSSRLKKPERDAAIAAIKELSSASTGLFAMPADQNEIPHKGVEFEVIGDRGSEDILTTVWNIISEYIKRINRALGIPDDLGSVTAVSGSFARARVQFDMFIATVVKAQGWLERIANKLVCTIIYYNFQNLPEDYYLPKWSFDSIEEEFDLAKAQYFETLINSRVVQPDEEFIREDFAFPPAPEKLEPEVTEEPTKTEPPTEGVDPFSEPESPLPIVPEAIKSLLKERQGLLNRIRRGK